jgi:agmatinase
MFHLATRGLRNSHSGATSDTWKPEVFGGAPSEQAAINHGTYFHWANEEGLIKNTSSIASVVASLST